ncbi:MAG: hypothetical protein MUF54_11470, partial [Polyangiaceae bacterium]|nr:hypothetical protein [Polyangiaceae bacterium]
MPKRLALGGLALLMCTTGCGGTAYGDPVAGDDGGAGGGGDGGAAGDGGCASVQGIGTCSDNADCTNKPVGDISRCRCGSCVPLASQDCTRYLGDASRTDSIYLGLLAPLTGPEFARQLGHAILAAVEAAVRKYNQIIVGQPGAPRSLTVVVCDETRDIVAATDHLVDTVGVKGIVGPFDEATLESIVAKTKAANVVVTSPFADGLSFAAKHASSGLVWSCAANRSGSLVYLK